MKTREAVLREIEQRTAMLVLTGLSQKQAHKQAMREVASRERGAAEAAGGPQSSPVPPATSSLPSRAHAELMEICERWIGHIWSRAEEKMERVARYVRTDRAKAEQPKPTIAEPSMGSAPVVVVEPLNVTADPKLQAAFPAPLVVTGFANAKLIPDAEFSQRFRDQTTANWRASIHQNEAIAKEREARSLQLQNRNRAGSRYIG
jgi:hypothetical protein